ncbi:unnamed protein product, partial [Ectocarpus sp. 12 AP-2014]
MSLQLAFVPALNHNTTIEHNTKHHPRPLPTSEKLPCSWRGSRNMLAPTSSSSSSFSHNSSRRLSLQKNKRTSLMYKKSRVEQCRNTGRSRSSWCSSVLDKESQARPQSDGEPTPRPLRSVPATETRRELEDIKKRHVTRRYQTAHPSSWPRWPIPNPPRYSHASNTAGLAPAPPAVPAGAAAVSALPP